MLPGQLRLRAAYEVYMRNPNATEQAHSEQTPLDTAGRVCPLAQEKAARSDQQRSRSEDTDEARKARLSRWSAMRHRRL